MKRYSLHLLLLTLSIVMVQLMLNPSMISRYKNPASRKIAPGGSSSPNHAPNKQKYSPAQLHRIYFQEHIHQSIERGKRGITS